MAKTLLAVDDSVTMRKVLEITFSGEDFQVITADDSQSALGRLAENPHVFLVDTVLGGEDGYALAKQLRQRNPGAPIIMLASRYSPYDQGRGRDAGADDWADKPFDTQQLIDKVRRIALAKEASAAAPRPAPVPVPAPAAAPASMPLSRGTQPSLGGAVPRNSTLTFGDSAPAPVAVPAAPPRPAIAPISATAMPAPVSSASAVAPPPRPTSSGAMPAAAAAVASVSNAQGQLAGKLGDLGLTPAQVEAVTALSREIVERVVWEVVPQLAETMIREEIDRLTRA